jgi:hypothetical protein
MKKINWHLVGIALVCVGIQLGMLLSFFIPTFPGMATVMALSILLTLDYKSLVKRRMPSCNQILVICISFQIIMLLYLYFCMGKLNAGFGLYHFYVIALIVALSSLKRDMDISSFPNYLYVISFPLLILEAWLCNKGLVVGHIAWEQRQANAAYSLEPFAFAQGALINIFAVMSIKLPSNYKRLLTFVSVLLGIYIMLECGKRTPMLVFFVGIILFFYWKGLISVKVKKKTLIVFVLCISFICIAFLFIQWFQEKVMFFLNNIYAGVLNLMGDTSVQDSTGSAFERVGYRNFAYNYINDNFDLLNIMFGGGYAILWLDNPLLQSFLDMGLLGCCLYSFLILFYPARLLLIKSDEPAFVLARLLSLYAILSVFNSGHPYMWIKYAPICILSVVFCKLSRDGKI